MKKGVIFRRAHSAGKRFQSAFDIESLDIRARMHDPTQGRSQLFPNADIRRFGRPFLGGFGTHRVKGRENQYEVKIAKGRFESPVVIGISWAGMPDFPFAEMALGFKRGRVTIESVKGEFGEQFALGDFSAGAGRPWPNYLIQKTMAVARRMGYSSIALRDVETLHFYKEPFLYDHLVRQIVPEQEIADGISPQRWTQIRDIIRARMKKFYNSFRRKMGFRRREGPYFVRSL